MTKLKELEQRLRDEPDNLGLRVMVAGALHEAGRRNDAVELYRSVAIAYRDQGRPQQAITVCRSILELAPGDPACHELLAALLASQPAPRASPPPGATLSPLPRPSPVPRPSPRPLPRPSPARLPSPDPFEEPRRRSSGEMTPLPTPLAYHDADPTTGTLQRLTPADLPPSLREELAAYPEIAGIAAAARQISASLIAANRLAETQELDDDDLAAELDTGRVMRDRPRTTPSASVPTPLPPTPPPAASPPSPPATTLRRPPTPAPPVRQSPGPVPPLRRPPTPPPALLDPPTPPPPLEPPPLPASPRSGPSSPPPMEAAPGEATLDDEKTEPRELPTRVRPPSIAPQTTATGPLAGAFFAPLPPRTRGAVLQRFRRRMVAAGTTLIRRGETGHGLVIVVRGRLDVHGERSDGTRVELAAIAAGEFVGEASLLARKPAAAHVIAGVDSEVLLLGADDFYDVASAFPVLRAELEAVAERRAREHAAL